MGGLEGFTSVWPIVELQCIKPQGLAWNLYFSLSLRLSGGIYDENNHGWLCIRRPDHVTTRTLSYFTVLQ